MTMSEHSDRSLRLLVARSSVGKDHVPLHLVNEDLEMASLPFDDLRGANLSGANLRGVMLWGGVPRIRLPGRPSGVGLSRAGRAGDGGFWEKMKSVGNEIVTNPAVLAGIVQIVIALADLAFKAINPKTQE